MHHTTNTYCHNSTPSFSDVPYFSEVNLKFTPPSLLYRKTLQYSTLQNHKKPMCNFRARLREHSQDSLQVIKHLREAFKRSFLYLATLREACRGSLLRLASFRDAYRRSFLHLTPFRGAYYRSFLRLALLHPFYKHIQQCFSYKNTFY